MPDQPVSQPQPNLAPPDMEKSMADPQSATEIPKPPHPQRKTPFLIVLVIVLFTSILFIPIPHYQFSDNLRCKPGQECKSGWLFNPSLYRSLIDFILQTNISETIPLTSPIPTTDPTANWKTYTNSQNRFSFKYPNSFTLSECKQGLHLFETSSGQKASEYCETPPFGIISIDYSTSSLSTGYSKSTDFQVVTEKTNVSGKSAEKQTITKINEAPGPDYLVTLSFTHNSNNYLITLRDKDYTSDFDQILSTFEFTSEKLRGWQTHSTDSFSISYPDHWSRSDGVFIDNTKNHKVAELSPGHLTLKDNVSCSDLFDRIVNGGETIEAQETNYSFSFPLTLIKPEEQATINDTAWHVLIIESGVEPSGENNISVWYPNIYCTTKGPRMFSFTYYELNKDPIDTELVEKVLSTFEFKD